jgi:magnesium-transporting ATPase (P-type)
MVTGDHPQTAVAINREIGLFGADPLVITGDQVHCRRSWSSKAEQKIPRFPEFAATLVQRVL